MKLLGAKHEKVEVGPRGSGGTEQETTQVRGCGRRSSHQHVVLLSI